jgi:hypothetical protein
MPRDAMAAWQGEGKAAGGRKRRGRARRRTTTRLALTWRSGWWRCAGAQCGQMLAQQARQKMLRSFFLRDSCAGHATKKLSATSPPTHPAGAIPIHHRTGTEAGRSVDLPEPASGRHADLSLLLLLLLGLLTDRSPSDPSGRAGQRAGSRGNSARRADPGPSSPLLSLGARAGLVCLVADRAGLDQTGSAVVVVWCKAGHRAGRQGNGALVLLRVPCLVAALPWRSRRERKTRREQDSEGEREEWYGGNERLATSCFGRLFI